MKYIGKDNIECFKNTQVYQAHVKEFLPSLPLGFQIRLQSYTHTMDYNFTFPILSQIDPNSDSVHLYSEK